MPATEFTLGTGEAAERLGMSLDEIRRLARDGKLPHQRVGRRYLFSDEDLSRYSGGNGRPRSASVPERPSESTQSLIDVLMDSNSDLERERAVAALASVPDKEAAAACLIELLSDHDDDWRRCWLVTALASVNTPEAVRAVARRMVPSGDPFPWVRFRAALALARMSPPDLLDHLRKAIRDEDPLVRAVALRLLLERGRDEKALGRLLKMAGHPRHWDERWAACKALRRDSGTTGLREGIEAKLMPVLVERLRDRRESMDIKFQAALAVGSLEHRWREAVEALTDALHSGQREWVRRACVDALAMLARPEAKGALVSCLHDEDAEIQVRATRALKRILGPPEAVACVIDELLGEEDIRFPLLAAIRRIDADEAARALSNRLTDPDRHVAERASRALVQLGGEEAVRTLQAQRREAMDKYTELLGDADDKVMEQFEALMTQARRGFLMSMGMHAVIFVAGLVVLGLSLYVALVGGADAFTRWVGVGGSLGSLSTLLLLFYKDPLENIRRSVTNLVKVNVVFSGYVRQINQIDATFKQLYLAAQGFGVEEMKETVEVIQASVKGTMEEVKAYLGSD